MVAGIFGFSVVVIITSALIMKKHDTMDEAEIATWVVILAWGSLFWGMFLSKCAR